MELKQSLHFAAGTNLSHLSFWQQSQEQRCLGYSLLKNSTGSLLMPGLSTSWPAAFRLSASLRNGQKAHWRGTGNKTSSSHVQSTLSFKQTSSNSVTKHAPTTALLVLILHFHLPVKKALTSDFSLKKEGTSKNTSIPVNQAVEIFVGCEEIVEK